MKYYEIEIIDQEIAKTFGIGVGLIEIVKPIEIWIKLPPHNDNKILFIDRFDNSIEKTTKEIYGHLIEQFKCFLGVESKEFNIDYNSLYNEPIKLGKRSFIKVLKYPKEN